MSILPWLLISTCEVYTPVRTADGRGGWAVDYEFAFTTNCRLRPASSTERADGAQQGQHISHVMYVTYPPPSPFVRGQRVVVDGVMSLWVEGVREPSMAGKHLELDCQEVQHETARTGILLEGS